MAELGLVDKMAKLNLKNNMTELNLKDKMAEMDPALEKFLALFNISVSSLEK